MDKKTANKNQELGDIKTFLENLIEPLSNTIGDDYECKLLNETAFGHNIEYVLNVEHTESGKLELPHPTDVGWGFYGLTPVKPR